MTRFTINTKKEYTDKQGNVKKQWNNVGTLVQFDNGEFALELSMFPDTKFFVFPPREKNEQQGISTTDIPF